MSDASGSGFGKYVPGFEFLHNLASQAAGGVAQGLGNSLPQLPNLGHWVAPTFNVEELDKRIEELKAVHFWLDQNTKALAATIQALEVQKMTLATLKTMNFSLGDVANALKIKAADAVAGFTTTAAPTAHTSTQFAGLEIPPRTYGNPTAQAPQPEEPEAEPEAEEEPAPGPAPRKAAARKAPASEPATGGVVDPMQWWGALSQQFQTIAANAMKDVAKQTALDTTRHVASGLTEQAVKTATGMAGKAADTVARNVGTAVGMGQAAARAVTRQPAAKATGKKPAKPAAQPSAKAAPAKKATPARKAAARPAPAQPLSTGDWPLPTSFFPGFQSVTGQPSPAPAPAQKVAKKAAAKAPARRR
ncbi:MAG: PhaM family polyhydroxyalkanoate granule multifunctional regulatory protein [Hydrogenophaga sp.]|uniref:PhaM family polyhydroxyalkanoate granule multifunctional regulatory protein n=1 Tax=Hydrogenophaga sp. TaxID=1904254 RepID=UPI003D9AE1CB